MINKTKTKILTLSVASALGLAAITVLASNANNLLDFQGGVKQNAHLELNELKLIEKPTKPGVTSKTDVTWKMDDNELVATKEAKGTTNRVEGQGTLSIGGQSNSISESESFILGGKNNTLNAKTSIIGASNGVEGVSGDNNIVFASTGVSFLGGANIIISSDSSSVTGSNNIVLSTLSGEVYANGSMAIGHGVRISHDGTFVFNGKDQALSSPEKYTTLIYALNGMIINANKRKGHNVGLTVNGGIKVGQITNLDQQGSLITQDNCLQLKSTEKDAISLKCRDLGTDNVSKFQTPKCGRNAANYHYTDSRWKGAENTDFCAQGTFEGDKSFRSEEQRKTPTGIGSYADRGFTYDFTICFRDKDPLCAPKNLSKTWRCKTDQGNAVVCEANLQIKPMQCATNQHLEDEGKTKGTAAQGRKCLPNKKQVPCAKTGTAPNHATWKDVTVEATRNSQKNNWDTPKCDFECKEGYIRDGNYCKEKPYCKTPNVTYKGRIYLVKNSDQGLTETMTGTLVGSGNGGSCQYMCKNGYVFNENGGRPECIQSCRSGDDIKNAYPVGGIHGDVLKNTLIATGSNETGPCLYKCKVGYKMVWKNGKMSCEKPINGKCGSQINYCLQGKIGDKWTDQGVSYWQCKGLYGGKDDDCSYEEAVQEAGCTGTIANATLGSGQDTGLTGTHRIQLVKTIDQNKRCQAVCDSGYEAKEDSTSHKLYCAKKEVIKNKICKGKKTTQSQRCVVTNKEEFKRKINQNVGYYPFLDNHTIRLKRGRYSFGIVGGIYDPEGNRHEMPNFVRYGSPKGIETYDKIFVPSSIIEGTNSYFKYYRGKDGNHLSPYSSITTGWTDDLYLELKDPNMEENWINLKTIRDNTWKIQHSGNGVFKTNDLKLYAKLGRGASGEFSDDSLDNFCYYNKEAKKCFSRAWALECETGDKIIEQNCRQYTNENACRNNRKCERGEE